MLAMVGHAADLVPPQAMCEPPMIHCDTEASADLAILGFPNPIRNSSVIQSRLPRRLSDSQVML
jgi:hypothetical protein